MRHLRGVWALHGAAKGSSQDPHAGALKAVQEVLSHPEQGREPERCCLTLSRAESLELFRESLGQCRILGEIAWGALGWTVFSSLYMRSWKMGVGRGFRGQRFFSWHSGAGMLAGVDAHYLLCASPTVSKCGRENCYMKTLHDPYPV